MQLQQILALCISQRQACKMETQGRLQQPQEGRPGQFQGGTAAAPTKESNGTPTVASLHGCDHDVQVLTERKDDGQAVLIAALCK
jgi:hypothetical protein